MKQAVLFSLAGTLLITLSIILHIICVATPYYSQAELNNIGPKIADYIKNHAGSQEDVSGFKEAMENVQETIRFGMWKLCVSATVKEAGNTNMEMCLKWGAKANIGMASEPATLVPFPGWMKGVQAMAIIGVLIAGGAATMAFINLVTQSKGDRQRLIHIFTLVTCVAAGVFMLIGDVIMAAKYKTIFIEWMDTAMLGVGQDLDQFSQDLLDLLMDEFYLSWGFALDIVAVALVFLSGVAHFLGGRVALNESGII